MTVTVPEWAPAALAVLVIVGGLVALYLSLRRAHRALERVEMQVGWLLQRLQVPWAADVGRDYAGGPRMTEIQTEGPGAEWEEDLGTDAEAQAENPILRLSDEDIARIERFRRTGRMTETQLAELAEELARNDDSESDEEL